MRDQQKHRICSYAEAVREALQQEMLSDERVFLMGEDIGVYGGSFHVLQGLYEEFGPERVLETPISEAGFTGAAVGAALMGSRPVVEIMFSDFLTVAMDQIVNHAAKYRFMFGGGCSVPMVIRTPGGCGTGAAAQHSQSIEAWFCHVPGLKVVVPSTPYDAKGLLLAAIRDPNPVLVFEQKLLYGMTAHVPEEPYVVPIGKAEIRRRGNDVTLVTYGRMTGIALEAADAVSMSGISMEVIDLRTLSPLDMETVLGSVRQTGRLMIVHEAVRNGGIGAEVAARVAEDREIFGLLKAPVCRVCGADTPIPFAASLEASIVPSVDDIIKRAEKLFD